jgi:hypothetical protein
LVASSAAVSPAVKETEVLFVQLVDEFETVQVSPVEEPFLYNVNVLEVEVPGATEREISRLVILPPVGIGIARVA